MKKRLTAVFMESWNIYRILLVDSSVFLFSWCNKLINNKWKSICLENVFQLVDEQMIYGLFFRMANYKFWKYF